MEKDNIISQLYTLRAGLSVISQEKKKIDSQIANNERNRSERSSAFEKGQKDIIEQAKDRLKNAEKECASSARELEKTTDIYNKLYSVSKKSVVSAGFLTVIEKVIAIFGIVLGVAVVLFGLFLIASGIFIPIWVYGGLSAKFADIQFLNILFGGINTGNAHAFWFIVLIGIVVVVLGMVGWFRVGDHDHSFFISFIKVELGRYKVFDIRNARKKLDGAQRDIDLAQQKMTNAKNVVLKCKEELKEVQNKSKKQATELENSLTMGKAALTEYLKPRFQASIALFNGLEALFGKLLDVRDWGNLDYLIYSLETGRADSVKEALQLADREEQTNRIVQAVAMASAAICRSISTGLARLQNDMRVCFNTLANEMTRQNAMIMGGISDVSAQVANVSLGMAGLSGAIAELSSETRLRNSLLEESNQTSSRLADDVHKLRYYADYAQMRS